MKNLTLLANLFPSGVFSRKKRLRWENDIDQAKELANNESRVILLFFQIPDRKTSHYDVEKNVFNTDEFISCAGKNLVMLRVNFPLKKKNALSEERQKRNNLLADRYNPQGIFPYAVILDKEGVVLGETLYLQTSANEFIKRLDIYRGC